MPEETQEPKTPGSETKSEHNLRDVIDRGTINLEEAAQAGHTPPESPAVLTRKLAELAGVYPLPNLAVTVCASIWKDTITRLLAEEKPLAEATLAAKMIFCSHLPTLSSRDEVSEFIACVAYGMANNILPGAEGTRLLYAAQVAHSVLPSPKRRKKAHKTSQNPPPEPSATPTEATT